MPSIDIEKYLGEDEQPVQKLDDTLLTDQRLIQKSSTWSGKSFESILLDMVVAINYTSSFNIFLLVLGLSIGVGGWFGAVQMQAPELIMPALFLGGVFAVLAYFSIGRKFRVHTVNEDVTMTLPSNKETEELLSHVQERIEKRSQNRTTDDD